MRHTGRNAQEIPTRSDARDKSEADARQRHFAALLARIEQRSCRVGVIGLGYVGLPLAVTAAARGLTTVGFDIDPAKIERLVAGRSYIEAIDDTRLASVAEAGMFSCTSDLSGIAHCDVVVICVPTPLTRNREPDLTYVTETARAIAAHIRPATLVVLESTTYPGTTVEVLQPVLAASGLDPGEEIFVAFSPEREDPGNTHFQTATIPKIVAGEGEEASRLAREFYAIIVDEVVAVSTTKTAEAIKITENIFRAVNIALVNELKVIYTAMGIDVWEVIAGAATKPFGFMPFFPGPGLGGHCIPIDPFYLTWKAREFELSTKFIELAGEINVNMPHYVVSRLRDTLDSVRGIPLSAARILVVGIAYKKNVSDMRESPSLRLISLLLRYGAEVDYYDPMVPSVPQIRDHPELFGRHSVRIDQVSPNHYHAILIATDHDNIDYEALAALAGEIVDTRNAFASRGLAVDRVTKA